MTRLADRDEAAENLRADARVRANLNYLAESSETPILHIRSASGSAKIVMPRSYRGMAPRDP